jgi:DNA-binding MarR family transcriptional regulator
MKTNENDPATREDLIGVTAATYMDLYALMQSATIAHWLMFELTFAQARALIILAAKKVLTVSQLARRLNVGNPTASLLVQKLVERGLVTRTEGEADRRQTELRLSEKGAEIGAGRRSEREKQWQGWLNQLSDEELSGLAHGLSALLAVVEAEAQSEAVDITTAG